MAIGRRDVLKVIAGAATTLGVRGARAEGPAIHRDVCILGGGSSGTYTAVRLRDLGKSVVVVERKGRLGGHCETFHDPVTGGTTDIGVIVFHDLPIVRSYFGRFGVPLVPFSEGGGETTFVDYRSGRVVPGYVPPQGPPLFAALGEYFGLLERYPYLEAGFNLPDPVPPDLLLPFGDFVSKFGLDQMVQTAFQFGQGLGDLLRLPTLYVMKNFGLGVLTNLFNNSFLSTAQFVNNELITNNSALYEGATTFLGEDVLFNAQVESVNRHSPHEIQLTVDTPDGRQVIHCKKLVVTFPPLLRNFGAFDLDGQEQALFGRFRPNYYWTAVARLTGIPDFTSVQNVGPELPYNQAPLFSLPSLPGIYSVYPSGLPGLHHVKYGSSVPLTDNEVRANMIAGIQQLATAGSFPVQLDPHEPLAVFSSHSPFELTVGAQDIASGFYRSLYGLQGRNNTFYNGATFHTHDSSLLWQFTEGLLPQIAG